MESLVYKCPNCYAEIKFSAAEQKFCCDYCGSKFTEEEMQAVAQAAESLANRPETEEVPADDGFAEHTAVYHCDSCGASIMAEDTTAATFCYYCHNPVILTGRVSGEFLPKYVLPFQVSHEQAISHFEEWCKKHWFLPSDFLSASQREKITGLYVPFWVTDCDVSGEMDALGKKIRSWTSGNYRYTETREYALTRKATIVLRGLPADGASHIDDDLMEAVEPFDYKAVRPFAMQYLSGFYAEKYDMEFAKMFPRIQQRAVQASDQVLRASMKNYTTVSVTRSDIKVMQTKWDYMLLPVWFMTYKYRDKIYEFALNGQTAKFVGNPPVSRKKLALFSGGLGLLAAVITVIVEVLMK